MKEYLIRINCYKFVLLAMLALFLTSQILNYCLFFLENSDGPNLKIDSITNILMSIFLAGILTGIVETFINQHLIFIILKRLILKEKHLAIAFLIISSLLFGLCHAYSLYYIIITIFMGVVLAYAYYISLFRKESAFWTTAIIHGSYNTILIFVSLLKGYSNL